MLSDFLSLSNGNNTKTGLSPSSMCCDLLSDFLSLSNGNNAGKVTLIHSSVVICFQIFYLCPTATTSYRSLSMLIQLWFAFRFFIFVQRQQRWRYYYIEAFCCDLLSDFLSLSNGNNKALRFLSSQLVVICFQIFYLCPTATTVDTLTSKQELLWFAFRFFIFVQRQQRFIGFNVIDLSCDLLSDFLSLSNGNNSTLLKYWIIAN